MLQVFAIIPVIYASTTIETDDQHQLRPVCYLDVLPDEILLNIFSYTYIEPGNLCDTLNLAHTNTRLHRLSEDAFLLNAIKKYFFKGFPEEFFVADDGRLYSNSLHSLAAMMMKYHVLQLDEIARLEILLRDKSYCISRVDQQQYLNSWPGLKNYPALTYHNVYQYFWYKTADYIQDMSEDDIQVKLYKTVKISSIDKNSQQLVCNRYHYFEQMLDEINYYFMATSKYFLEGDLFYHESGALESIHIFACYNKSMTRLTHRMIASLANRLRYVDPGIQPTTQCYVSLLLINNNLKWLPDALFDIPDVIRLDVANNCLKFLPKSMLNWRNCLQELNIGNCGPYHDGNSIFSRLEGNSFQNIPASIYALKSLRTIKIARVGLKAIGISNLLDALPKLEFINISENNLKTNLLSYDTYLYDRRNVTIESCGNNRQLSQEHMHELQDQYIRNAVHNIVNIGFLIGTLWINIITDNPQIALSTILHLTYDCFKNILKVGYDFFIKSE